MALEIVILECFHRMCASEQRVLQGVSEPAAGAQTAAVLRLCHLPQQLLYRGTIHHFKRHSTLSQA